MGSILQVANHPIKTYTMNHSVNVLLVEDDKDDQLFFSDAISEIEDVVLQNVASNGIEALRMLETSTALPDLIFMDINMPMMNGIECLIQIIRNPHLKNIPVVILSTDISGAELICNLGAKAFIKKPADRTTLRTKLVEMIHRDFSVAS